MTRMEKCQALRADKTVHYNCCQAVLVPFAAEMGISEEQAYKMGAHFGSGMRHGSTCGAITGALMVLGMLGYEGKAASALLRDTRQTHGALDCATLLRLNAEKGAPQKEHCDGMVYDLLQAVEKIIGG